MWRTDIEAQRDRYAAALVEVCQGCYEAATGRSLRDGDVVLNRQYVIDHVHALASRAEIVGAALADAHALLEIAASELEASTGHHSLDSLAAASVHRAVAARIRAFLAAP
jgi:hypothetical protein